MVNHSLVSVVDDDESVRESLPDLLREFGFAAQAFSSAEAFLASDYVDQTRCLVLDIAMPGMSGPELEGELARRRQADSDRLHNRPGRRGGPCRSARGGGRGVPAEAVQRHGIAECVEHRARGRVIVVAAALRLAA